ncbi:CoA-binding protein [Candidatus Raskinella chloraquaticus]|uniref:CoA-binding protein n=1 Tax=Candidatus Raskinella chloraquaticus TaxID=1951219 RepID=A0A1W9I0F8_9HYPH|nr:MAG: CoA-binding protein [Proteobacteria bacterium SG_bin8]
MDHDHYADNYIRDLLDEVKTIAVVGASANAARPSFFVVRYLAQKGYDVYPVNPGHAGKQIAGCMTYASLGAVPVAIDMVDIFRNSEAALGVVQDALALQPLPKAIWMQLGVRNDEAAALAQEHGIKIVMNRCPKIEFGRLSGEIGWVGVNSRVLSSKRATLHGKGFQQLGLASRRDKP